MRNHTEQPTRTIIKPSSGWRHLDLGELWSYRELLWILTLRDIKVRYKQTVIGVAWAVIQPFMTMVVFSIFFGRLAKIPSDGFPYPVFVYSGLLPWMFFSAAISNSGNSLVASAHLLSKVYFPRLIIPASTVVTNLVDFLISFGILMILMVFYQYPPTMRTLQLTLREVRRCTQKGIIINTFMLDSGRFMGAFVTQMARINKGRVFFTSADSLGQYLLVDYMTHKKKRL